MASVFQGLPNLGTPGRLQTTAGQANGQASLFRLVVQSLVQSAFRCRVAQLEADV